MQACRVIWKVGKAGTFFRSLIEMYRIMRSMEKVNGHLFPRVGNAKTKQYWLTVREERF